MPVRDATMADIPALLTIYNEVVANTTAIYDQQISTLEERQKWFEARRAQGFPILVMESGGEVSGFSTYGEWRSRWGYRFSVEHSVHVRTDCRGQGIGTALIEALFPVAVAAGVHAMMGHIDSAAAASLHLHQKLGFRTVGTFQEVGRLQGDWLNVVAVQKLFR